MYFSDYLDVPPEMVREQPYDFQVDVWSLGIIVYEMVTGCSPFTADSEKHTMAKIKEYSDFSTIKRKLEDLQVSGELLDFLKRLINPETTQRMKVEDVLVHPWIKPG